MVTDAVQAATRGLRSDASSAARASTHREPWTEKGSHVADLQTAWIEAAVSAPEPLRPTEPASSARRSAFSPGRLLGIVGLAALSCGLGFAWSQQREARARAQRQASLQLEREHDRAERAQLHQQITELSQEVARLGALVSQLRSERDRIELSIQAREAAARTGFHDGVTVEQELKAARSRQRSARRSRCEQFRDDPLCGL